MPKNENTRLANRHTLYLARSGYGKSQTLIRRSGIPGRGRRINWDPNKDHKGHRFARLGDFFRALKKCELHGSGNYQISYTGEAAPDIFEDFARGLWAILDGRQLTYCRIEEYSDCCDGPGPLLRGRYPYHRRLWTQSRKYGGILHVTSQRPQLISKDALGNAGIIWASSMDNSAAKRVGLEMDVKPEQLRSLKPGEFYRWEIGGEAVYQKVFTPRAG